MELLLVLMGAITQELSL